MSVEIYAPYPRGYLKKYGRPSARDRYYGDLHGCRNPFTITSSTLMTGSMLTVTLVHVCEHSRGNAMLNGVRQPCLEQQRHVLHVAGQRQGVARHLSLHGCRNPFKITRSTLMPGPTLAVTLIQACEHSRGHAMLNGVRQPCLEQQRPVLHVAGQRYDLHGCRNPFNLLPCSRQEVL